MTLQHPICRSIKTLIVHINDLLSRFDFQQNVQDLCPFLRVKNLNLFNHVSRRHGSKLIHGI